MNPALVVDARGLRHRYRHREALRGIDLGIAAGSQVALIGPDGVGKSSLLGLIAGAKRLQQGELHVLDGNFARRRERLARQPRIAYMPQGLGRNLYPDLSVRENLEFFGRLFDQGPDERRQRIAELLAATGLSAFDARPAGKLSGGMKQKLGLCCALLHDPDLLILDEPTTGVDPLSRRQFWELIARIRANRPGMSVLVATSYMDEAMSFERVLMMDDGRLIGDAEPGALLRALAVDSLEAAFVRMLPEARRGQPLVRYPERRLDDREPAIEARELSLRFGDFTAVDRVSFRIARGEIFGFLGSNGCGKTTTMKVLTGLLPASEGEARLFGQPIAVKDGGMRQRIGYMTQAYSLYGELTVAQNLALHAQLYQLSPERAPARIAELVAEFGLADHLDSISEGLPLGLRQRLSLAVAILHEPEILILDEPTSGVDPVARDQFWNALQKLAREKAVTIFISTHFMSEATRCDRIAFMHAGRVLATGAPADLQATEQADSLDEAFIAVMRRAIGDRGDRGDRDPRDHTWTNTPRKPRRERRFSRRRLLAYSWREMLELRRDPVRLTVALLGTFLLMLVFGFGITMDVEDLRFAALDRDQSPESRAYLEHYRGSSYFREMPPLANDADLENRLRDGELSLALEIPSRFGRDLRSGHAPEVAVWVDGAMPFRAETVSGYAAGIHRKFLEDMATRSGVEPPQPAATVEPRFRYNQAFRSLDAMVPATIALLLVFIPAILSALAVVREKEMGSITNLYVTPVSRLEFLLGKQLPYVALAFGNFLLMTAMAETVFGVPLKGSFAGLSLAALAYVIATTGIGLLMSTFTASQTAAIFGTAIATMMPATQFSGMLQPVSTLEGGARLVGTLFPTTYFLKASVGSFTKALGFSELLPFIGATALFIPVLVLVTSLRLTKQET